jgi:hypothetical protein
METSPEDPVDILGTWFMSTASPHLLSTGAEDVSPSYFLKPIDTGSIWLSIDTLNEHIYDF